MEIKFNDKDVIEALEEKKKLFSVGGEVQKFVDSKVIKLMKPYTPMDTGMLMTSPTRGTIIGTGKIEYDSDTPYARYQYYGIVYGPINIPIFENGILIGFRSPPKKEPTGRKLHYSTEKHPNAQRLWFEQMKADHKDDLLKGAMAIAVGRKR